MLFFSSSYNELFAGELNYMSMFGHNQEMIMNPPNNQMFASSPEFFVALSPLSSTDQDRRSHHLLHHEEELHHFPGPTTKTTEEDLINGHRTGYCLSQSGDAGTQLSVGRGAHPVMTSVAKVSSVGSSPGGAQIRSSKVGKKDRHSKIVTARGPRDRRMRLSLEVARRFFDLQDMLGYDKASQTVAWLLANSRSAIKILAKSAAAKAPASSSTTSDCEITSWAVQHHISTGGADHPITSTISDVAPVHQIHNKRLPTVSRPRKNKAMARTVHLSKSAAQARESRAMARARARERTWKKLCLRSKNAEEHFSRSPFEVESGGSPSSADGGIGADNKCRRTPPIFTAGPSSGPFGPNAYNSSHLESHGLILSMIEHKIQQNWEAGDYTARLLHMPASIGPHDDEGKYLPSFSPT